MKGFIFVVLVLGLLISAPEIRGQSVPDQDQETTQPPQDEDVGGTSITFRFGPMCPKGCILKNIKQRVCVKRLNRRIPC